MVLFLLQTLVWPHHIQLQYNPIKGMEDIKEAAFAGFIISIWAEMELLF